VIAALLWQAISSQEPQQAADLTQTGKADDTRINIDQEHEVKYWSEKFSVSRDRLRSAVAKAGPMVKDVRAHLDEHRA
jgi:hypothetical protein